MVLHIDIDISEEKEFSDKAPQIIDNYYFRKENNSVDWRGKEWPVVYILFNRITKKAYVGETIDAKNRLSQHLATEKRNLYNSFVLISDNCFNKSVILDLESYLINHMQGDTIFDELQNGTMGLQKSSYYQDKDYEADFKNVWKKLKSRGLAEKELEDIENEDVFKYSPYKEPTSEQFQIASKILAKLASQGNHKKGETFLVKGKAGTGKTVFGIYLAKLLSMKYTSDIAIDDSELLSSLKEFLVKKPNYKVGLVIPMQNLRTIIKNAFRKTYGLSAKIVLSPDAVAKATEKYDLLIVDEAHRLRQRKNLSSPSKYASFKKNNDDLKLGENGTELDWILAKSHNQVFLYDISQRIKPTDIPKEKLLALKQKDNEYILDTQLRCGKAGEKYVEYIEGIFSDNPPEKQNFKDYELVLFDNVSKMTNSIKELDKSVGLCRNVAGYAWKWPTKGTISVFTENDPEKTDQLIKNGKYDIDIHGSKYIWNIKYDGWVSAPNSVNEIGCIHTIQGFDLNYAGVIIGNDLKYSKEKGLFVDRYEYKDRNGYAGASDEELKEYILHIYKVLSTRGIMGTYIYACDKGLREYLSNYMKTNHAPGLKMPNYLKNKK